MLISISCICPRFPQSSGKAENGIRTVERLLTKYRAAGVSEFQALLATSKLHARKERQCKYFNYCKRPLSPVKSDETVRVRLPSGTWRRAEYLRKVASRSYDVFIDGEVRGRNHKDMASS